MNTDKCLIWPDSPASIGKHVIRENNKTRILWKVDSPRSGGSYQMFDDGVDPQLQMQRLDDAERARLTTLLVDSRNQSGNDRAEVTAELIERARRQPPLSVDERAERLLRFTEKKARRIGETVTLTVRGDGGSSPEFALAMAWSESTDLSEVTFLRDYLDRQGWIDGNSAYQYAVTVEGHRRIADVKKSADATQAFVAMWFDHEMRAAYTNGIEPAIESAGYKPMRIDQKVDAVKIDDEIIAEIRRSRFLVADFTHGKAGARGGVYFEAGFALGLGIPVIYTCREDAIDSIHFDTRQYHHTLWEGPEDLRDKLKKRILALIGEGPEVSTGSQATRAAPG